MRTFLKNNYVALLLFTAAALMFVAAANAGTVGIGGTTLRQHNHSGASQGGSIQALQLTGNFQISGNNAGNINLSTAITGTNFIWKPSSAALIGGYASDDSFYVNNIGGYSWIGGYNTMSRGDYSLAFGTNVKNYRAASVALGYYLRNNAGNSVIIGSGPGYGGNAYAVNDDTGSIKFFPFTTTTETRPMLDMRRDNSAVTVGTWTFTNQVNAASYYGDGSHLTGVIPSSATGYYPITVASATYVAVTFASTQTVISTNYNTTQTSFLTCVPGSTMTITATIGSRLLVGFTGIGQAQSGQTAYMTFLLNGVPISGAKGITAIYNTVNPWTFSYLTAPITQTVNTLCLSIKMSAGTGYLTVDTNSDNKFWAIESK